MTSVRTTLAMIAKRTDGCLGLVLAVLAGVASSGCTSARAAPRSGGSLDARADGRASGAASVSACAPWGGRGFSLLVRAQSSHALFFREFAYNDRSGEVRVHDSDLFAAPDGSESREPRVIQRTLTLGAPEREALAAELMSMCPDEQELSALDAPGGGTALEVTSASGTTARVRVVPSSPANVARRVLARFVRYFPELRSQ